MIKGLDEALETAKYDTGPELVTLLENIDLEQAAIIIEAARRYQALGDCIVIRKDDVPEDLEERLENLKELPDEEVIYQDPDFAPILKTARLVQQQMKGK